MHQQNPWQSNTNELQLCYRTNALPYLLMAQNFIIGKMFTLGQKTSEAIKNKNKNKKKQHAL